MARTRAQRIADTLLAYRRLFDSPEGKVVLYDLMKSCHVLQTVHTSGDPYETAYKEGERSVVLRILRTLRTNPEAIIKMMEDGENTEA